ncbi:hypothetical protein ELQ92_02110 [Labedella populi]|uniref:Transmembrane protein n=1 Tax=Labedella populi TaxID=2498850 RepID=A0A3S4ECF1_9MICO|nr:hypothetical protein [Labedella populi]RWZ68069.1 hypothetical protein ELQ92_02110 [Labedella populi]
MKLYSDFRRQRTGQILGDVIALVVLVAGILLAVTIHGTITALDTIGRNVQESGRGLSSTMSDVGDALSSTPLIGESIGGPFDAASSAADSLATAGENWQLGVHTLAAIVSWMIVAIVVAILALAWVRPRLSSAVRRGRLARLAASPNAVELLAFRALTEHEPRDVLAVDPAVIAAWRRGDPAVVRHLAALELRSAGVRLPR